MERKFCGTCNRSHVAGECWRPKAPPKSTRQDNEDRRETARRALLGTMSKRPFAP